MDIKCILCRNLKFSITFNHEFIFTSILLNVMKSVSTGFMGSFILITNISTLESFPKCVLFVP